MNPQIFELSRQMVRQTHRPFRRYLVERDQLVSRCTMITGQRGVGKTLKKSLPDPGDLMFLEVADATSDRVLVTGNAGHSPQNPRGDVQFLRLASAKTGGAPRAGGCRPAR